MSFCFQPCCHNSQARPPSAFLPILWFVFFLHPSILLCLATCAVLNSARRGTMMEGLRSRSELVVIVVIGLPYGCPVQVIVQTYGLDEPTVKDHH